MNAAELKRKYLNYFKKQHHAIIDSAPLIPEHDPTVLFITAGMQPLVPFLMGQSHPLGQRLADVQKCLRTDDIEEIGDATHHTFFEMLGNWSLGDYFKKEAIKFSFDFLTKELKLPITHLAATCFEGDKIIPRDEEAARAWLSLGLPKERIAFLGRKDNWWGPAGETGPCGPCTEMHYWTGQEQPPKVFDPKDKRWVEIGNDVLMEYQKNKDGTYTPLKQKNIDFGGGVERILAVINHVDDNYLTDLFLPLIKELEQITGHKYAQNKKSMRIIVDHTRAIVFVLGDERSVTPSNVDQGYILRRFIRRAVRHLRSLGVEIEKVTLTGLARLVIKNYSSDYPLLKEKEPFILEELSAEEEKFKRTLEKGLNEFQKLSILPRVSKSRKKEFGEKIISGKEAFLLFQSYGFPLELTEELAKEKGLKVDVSEFQQEYCQHQQLSRIGAEKKFKGGLADASVETTRLHTATHLLNEALRRILKFDIKQCGSNITAERLRFDFNFDRKLTAEELKQIEEEVNRVIKLHLEVKRIEMPLKEALAKGACGEFGNRYPEKVSVYYIENYSKEICMGPHVNNTKELGHFKILKEESSAAGVRRIKAVLE